MLKTIDRKQVEELVAKHPFSDVADMRTFIDQVFHDLWKQSGRTTDAIQTAKAHRASI